MPDGRQRAESRSKADEPANAAQDGAAALAASPALRRLARLACQALHATDVIVMTCDGAPVLAHGEAGPDAPLLAHARRLAADILANDTPLIAEDVPLAARVTAKAARHLLGGLALRAPSGRPLGALVAFTTGGVAFDPALRGRLADIAGLFAEETGRACAPPDRARMPVETPSDRIPSAPLPPGTAAALATARLADFLRITRGMIVETDPGLTIVGCAGSEAAFGRAAAALIGVPLEQAVGSDNLDETVSNAFQADLAARRSFGPLVFVAGEAYGGARDRLLNADAEAERAIEIIGAPLVDGAGGFGGYRCALSDVTERRRVERAARALADSDWLTGLANRRAFQERLQDSINEVKRRGTLAALILIDLDRFKRTNDTLGHAAGDALLRETGARLMAFCGPRDTAARIGGDEFAVIATGIGSLPMAETLAAQIAAKLAEPVSHDGKALRGSASLGVSLITPGDNPDPDLSLTQADAALYAAKRRRRGSFSSYNRSMETRPRERRRLELDLRDAIGTGQLALRYQPICDVPSGNCLGFEALLRWSPPGRGSVPPDTFIPLAEEYGLIQRIDEFVLNAATASAAAWEGGQRLAVNVSSDWFATDQLAEYVEAALRKSGLSPERLEIEVTERIFIDNESSARTQIAQLKALGCRVALDDFGTGYSSLATLSALPFDKVKLASSFIHGLGTSRRAEAVARAVLQLGGALGMAVCAEGVETEDQFAFLQMHRCDEVQGHLIGLPVEDGELGKMLAGWNARALRASPYFVRPQGR